MLVRPKLKSDDGSNINCGKLAEIGNIQPELHTTTVQVGEICTILYLNLVQIHKDSTVQKI